MRPFAVLLLPPVRKISDEFVSMIRIDSSLHFDERQEGWIKVVLALPFDRLHGKYMTHPERFKRSPNHFC